MMQIIQPLICYYADFVYEQYCDPVHAVRTFLITFSKLGQMLSNSGGGGGGGTVRLFPNGGREERVMNGEINYRRHRNVFEGSHKFSISDMKVTAAFDISTWIYHLDISFA